MSKGRTSRAQLGLFLSLVLGLFAFVVAPVPAQAETRNVGGLVFTYDTSAGTTTTVISEPNNDGIVTISGPGDVSVYQVTAGPGYATGIQVGGGAEGDYTGTLTIQNTTLTAGTEPALSFANADAQDEDGNDMPPCTVILGQGAVLTTGAGANADAACVMASVTDDTLELQTGASIAAGKATLIGILVTNPTLGGKEAGDMYINFSGDAIVTGGNSADADKAGAIVCNCSGNGNLTIEVTGNPVVNGSNASSGTVPSGLLVNPTAAVTIEDGDDEVPPVVTIEGTGTLSFVGGQNATGTSGAGITVDSAVTGVSGGTPGTVVLIAGPGTVDATGGNGADVNAPAGNASSNVGGYGVVISRGSGGSSPSMLQVTDGVLMAQGGNGGAGVAANGAGGDGLNINGNTTAPGIFSAKNGVVLAKGGNGGTKQGSGVTAGLGGYGVSGSTSGLLQLSNGTETNNEGPTFTAVGGTSTDDVLRQAVYGLTTTNATIDPGNQKNDDFYPYVVLSDTVIPEDDDSPKLVGFAIGTSVDTTSIGKTIASVTKWVQVMPAPLQSVNVAVAAYSSSNALPYVVAQTERTMTGEVPDPTRTYDPTLTGVFEGLENIDTSDFATIAGITASLPDYDDVTITPTNNVSTEKSTTGGFYVVDEATGNTITIAPDGEYALPKGNAITALYPSITTVSSSTVPVVYTVELNTEAPGSSFPYSGGSALQNWNLYTNPSGDGTLVFGNAIGTNSGNNGNLAPTSLAQTGSPTWPVASDAIKVTTLPTTDSDDMYALVLASSTTQNPFVLTAATNYKQLMGYYDEQADPATQVPFNTVSGYNSNRQLTAEWGTFKLVSVQPSPTSVGQGGSTNLTATYTVTPYNNELESYNMYTAGASANWGGVFVNTGQGNIDANGITVTQTGGSTATSQPFTVTSVATVAANATADLGHYRIWPNLVQPGTPGTNPPDGIYAVVEVTAASGTPAGSVNVIRMFNPNTGEHLYTTDTNEARTLENLGWDNENVAWVSPTSSDVPIYRLYNQWNGDHMYTVSVNEYEALRTDGWTGEGIKLYSAPNSAENPPVYRLYNPYMTANGGAYAHLWTGDYNEYVTLGSIGWNKESVAWHALSIPNPL